MPSELYHTYMARHLKKRIVEILTPPANDTLL
jgi:hypothetical protein